MKKNRKNTSKSWILAKHEISELIKAEMLAGKKLKTRARSAKFKESGLAKLVEITSHNVEQKELRDIDDTELIDCDETEQKHDLNFDVIKRKGKTSSEGKS